ncbi:MAG: 4Fe-4S dicluster domain-containing protein [Acidimicrobiales bacterium]
MRSVFINPERCIGCLQCELACAVEHSTSQAEGRAFLEIPIPRKRVHVEAGPTPTFSFPNRCRHCDPAPCLQVCPSGAITRDDELGLVLVEPKRCIGCAMCAVVCPFDVVTFHPLADGPGPEVAVAVKCDGCVDRLRRGESPACSEVCKVDALVFGELNELVAAGRLRETGAVLAAAGATPTALPGGDPLAGWRAWGGARQAAALAAAGWAPDRLGSNGTARNGDAEGQPPTGGENKGERQ